MIASPKAKSHGLGGGGGALTGILRSAARAGAAKATAATTDKTTFFIFSPFLKDAPHWACSAPSAIPNPRCGRMALLCQNLTIDLEQPKGESIIICRVFGRL